MITLTKEQRNVLWDYDDVFMQEWLSGHVIGELDDLGLIDQAGLRLTDAGLALWQQLSDAGWRAYIDIAQADGLPAALEIHAQMLAADEPMLQFDRTAVDHGPFGLARAVNAARRQAANHDGADARELRTHVNWIGFTGGYVLTELQYLRGSVRGFDAWYQSKLEEMNNDEMLRYMYARFGDRSEVAAMTSEGITVDYVNEVGAKFSYFYAAPPRTIDLFSKDEQNGTGFLVRKFWRVEKKYVHATELKELMNPPGSIRSFIDYVVKLAHEAEAKFSVDKTSSER